MIPVKIPRKRKGTKKPQTCKNMLRLCTNFEKNFLYRARAYYILLNGM
jgi:hypothetical protein